MNKNKLKHQPSLDPGISYLSLEQILLRQTSAPTKWDYAL
jgi:hypothetical protein